MSRHQDYVLGFAFSPGNHYVALIEKQRPAWQAGKWNGIGGKVEVGEAPIDAMVREFREEAGAAITADRWREFLVLSGTESQVPERAGDTYRIHCFRASGVTQRQVRSATDERVFFVRASNSQVIYDHGTPLLGDILKLATDYDATLHGTVAAGGGAFTLEPGATRQTSAETPWAKQIRESGPDLVERVVRAAEVLLTGSGGKFMLEHDPEVGLMADPDAEALWVAVADYRAAQPRR